MNSNDLIRETLRDTQHTKEQLHAIIEALFLRVQRVESRLQEIENRMPTHGRYSDLD